MDSDIKASWYLSTAESSNLKSNYKQMYPINETSEFQSSSKSKKKKIKKSQIKWSGDKKKLKTVYHIDRETIAAIII